MIETVMKKFNVLTSALANQSLQLISFLNSDFTTNLLGDTKLASILIFSSKSIQYIVIQNKKLYTFFKEFMQADFLSSRFQILFMNSSCCQNLRDKLFYDNYSVYYNMFIIHYFMYKYCSCNKTFSPIHLLQTIV